MKKLALITLALGCAAGAFAQGTVVFNNRVAGTIVTHVYAPFPGAPAQHQIGNGTADSVGTTNGVINGTTSWAGYTPIGLNGTAGQYGGATVFAQLLGASGFNQPESSLLPSLGITTFRTGAAGGQVTAVVSTFANVAAGAPAGTLEMVAWDNSSGLYSTWAQASVAWLQGLIAAGNSGVWNQDNFGGVTPAPNMVNSTDGTQSARSFNLYFVPEPTSFALAGLGAAAMLIFRRRK